MTRLTRNLEYRAQVLRSMSVNTCRASGVSVNLPRGKYGVSGYVYSSTAVLYLLVRENHGRWNV
jgi:hypothetical protein